jgi:hypothetical protein
MLTFLTTIMAFFLSFDDAAALQKTAPGDLTVETAVVHLAAARVAAAVHRVDADLLLSIAHHESHYAATQTTAEPGHKTSCGVMTPIPKRTCAVPSLLEGYLEGAQHLRTWLDAARGNERTALLGYAGGYRMIKACAAGPVLQMRKGVDVNLCTVVDVMQGRARWIKRSRPRPTT